MWTLAVQNSDELIYIWSLYTCSDCRSSLEVEPVEKNARLSRMFFPELSRSLRFDFQVFPEPK